MIKQREWIIYLILNNLECGMIKYNAIFFCFKYLILLILFMLFVA